MPVLKINIPTEVAEVIDRLGEIIELRKLVDAEEKLLKETLEKNGKPPYVEGKLFRANLIERKRSTLDSAAVKEALGESWVTEHTKETKYSFYDLTRITT